MCTYIKNRLYIEEVGVVLCPAIRLKCSYSYLLYFCGGTGSEMLPNQPQQTYKYKPKNIYLYLGNAKYLDSSQSNQISLQGVMKLKKASATSQVPNELK